MIFPAHDPFDSQDQATLRHVCLGVLRRIERVRKSYVATCENRPELAALDANLRLVRFGGLVLAANAMAVANRVPGPDAERFLADLNALPPEEKPLKRMIRRIIRPKEASGDLEERFRANLTSGLCAVPGFDPHSFIARGAQGSEFMAEFAIDFPAIRELAFEMRKAFTTMFESEEHLGKLLPIYRRFEAAAYAGVDLDEVVAQRDRVFARTAPLQMSNAPEPA